MSETQTPCLTEGTQHQETIAAVFPATSEAVPQARDLTRELPDEQRDAAALVVSELVTNSVIHSETETVAVELTSSGDTLRIAVTDDDPDHMPEWSDKGLMDDHGRGMFIVQVMCTELSCESYATCKTVLAVLGGVPA